MTYQRLGRSIRGNLSRNASSALYRANDDDFTTSPSPALTWLARPDVGLVSFNNALQPETSFTKQLSDLVSHSPCAFVRNAHLAFELLGRYSIF